MGRPLASPPLFASVELLASFSLVSLALLFDASFCSSLWPVLLSAVAAVVVVVAVVVVAASAGGGAVFG